MHPWIGKSVFLAGMVALIVLRAPHEARSKAAPVAESRKGALETALLVGMSLGFLVLPLLGLTPLLGFADHALPSWAFGAGVVCLAASLWLFHRSHADLGTNWSVTLEVREEHRLVDSGVYRLVRHPMYTALFLYSFGELLLFPNWIAGPACLVAFTPMFLLRLRPEEQMMVDRFGERYEAYRRRTRRLIPYVW